MRELWDRRVEAFHHNIEVFRKSPVSELAGGLGDLGTLLPLMTAMAAKGSISLTATLIFTGLANIFTGAWFGIPVVVQPMKAIASVALARPLSLAETMAAGLTVAAVIFFLTITRLLEQFSRLVPVPIVKGIQLGAGISLVFTAINLVGPITWMTPSWADNLFWVTGLFFTLCATSKLARFPLALFLFASGMIYAGKKIVKGPIWGIYHPEFYFPSFSEWKTGAVAAGLGQVPLTVLNSIIATQHLSAELLPSRFTPSISELGFSVALSNVGSFFGAMPICHGSGGLAAQHRFGARSGASVMLFGLIKLILGLFLGDTLISLLNRFPHSFLGIMALASGIELSLAAETLNSTASDILGRARLSQEEKRDRWVTMLVTAGIMLGYRNVLYGAFAGIVCTYGLKIGNKMDEWWRRFCRERLHVSSGERRPLLAGIL
ncbi:putative sulfate transporter [Ascobolus immersus RN42]|uniref:Putative sulfate transporter n=1 Tax=Ascobolus immersus RN42 TaxID=1160509 RepID=A0A3N4HZE0_ASCIM|nr:putative sulfate transporter [Ascobolus immersus RN42]